MAPVATSSSQPLTSGGVPIVWTGGGTNVLLGSAGGQVIIKAEADVETGYVRVEIKGSVDHEDTTTEDVVAFEIGVEVVAGGLTTTTFLVVSVEDDSPVITNVADASLTGLLEDGFALDFSFGGDGPGTLLLTNSGTVMGTVKDSSLALTSHGESLTYVWEDGHLVARSESGKDVFLITPDADEQQYSVQLLDVLDQAVETVTKTFSWSASTEGGGNVDVIAIPDSTSRIVLTAHGEDGTNSSVNYSAQGMGVGTGAKIDPGEKLVLEIEDTQGNALTMTQFSFTANHLDKSEVLRWTAYGADGQPVDTGEVQGVSSGASGKADQEVQINLSEGFTRVVLEDVTPTAGKTNGYGVLSFSGNFVETSDQLADVTVSIGVQVTDADGDPTASSFDVTFTSTALDLLPKPPLPEA